LAAAIVFYISGHGFGHASRCIEVINAVLAASRDAHRRPHLGAPLAVRPLGQGAQVAFGTLECDTGVVQIDALTLDEADTIRRAASFHSDLVTRAASETRVLRELGAGLVVGDIPPLAFAVGAAAGIPSIALGNFTWDWIYGDYPRVRLAPSLLPTIRGAYAEGLDGAAAADVGRVRELLNVKDIPFIARHATRSREEVCKLLKLPADKPLVLMSFGGYGLPGLDTDVLDEVQEVHRDRGGDGRSAARKQGDAAGRAPGSFISINEEAMYDAGVRYEDLVGAADAVVTKPGYGIVSECIANDTAILYTSRGHFPEYDVLVEEMPKYVPHGLHRPRRPVRREVGGAPRQAAGAAEAEEDKPRRTGPTSRPTSCSRRSTSRPRSPAAARAPRLRLETGHERPDPRPVHLFDRHGLEIGLRQERRQVEVRLEADVHREGAERPLEPRQHRTRAAEVVEDDDLASGPADSAHFPRYLDGVGHHAHQVRRIDDVEHAVGKGEMGRVHLEQAHVRELLARHPLARLLEHAGREVDAGDVAVAGIQGGVDARADAHLEDAIAGLDTHVLQRLEAPGMQGRPKNTS
jgi:hypothetical protein